MDARCGLASGSPGSAPHCNRSNLGTDRRCEPVPRGEPGAGLVDDSRHEDRSGGASTTRSCTRLERIGRLPGCCPGRVRHRRDRGLFRSANSRLGWGSSHRCRGYAHLGRRHKRHPTACSSRAKKSGEHSSHLPPNGVFSWDLSAARAPRKLTGRTRQQPERRARLGTRSSLSGRKRSVCARDGGGRSSLPGGLGPGAARNRLAFRPYRSKNR